MTMSDGTSLWPAHTLRSAVRADPIYSSRMCILLLTALLTSTASLSVLPGSLLTDSENTRRITANARNPPARKFFMPNLFMLIRDGMVLLLL